METITHENIIVEGFPFSKIRSVKINHIPNEHGTATIVGEIKSDVAEEIIARIDETSLFHIKTVAEGQKEILFIGGVASILNDKEQMYNIVTIKLHALTYKLDIKRNERSFQQTSMSYGEIIKTVTKDWATTYIKVSDKPIGGLIMQFTETDWEFAKRMAAGLSAPIISTINEAKARIYVGLPPSTKTISVDTSSVTYGIDQESCHMQKANGTQPGLKEDFSSQKVESYEYLNIGDTIVVNEVTHKIKGVEARLIDGILTMSYSLLHEGSSTTNNLSSISVPPMPSVQSSGKMMLGEVKAVAKDKVQVHLIDIDKGGYDGGGDFWFPYSTAYSSSDGSGWYCMPEVGDSVRVFFPSGNEKDAFAASSVCAKPPTNTRHKSWKAPGGKEILLTDEGLYIIGKEGKIFINLTDEKGIEIVSDTNIMISSDISVTLQSGKDLNIVAENEVTIGTAEAYINMRKGSISICGTEVLVN